MTKYFILLIAIVSLLVSFGLVSNTTAHKNQSGFVNPTATPTSKTLAKIEKIELDRTELFISCPPGRTLKDGTVCDDNKLILVKVSVTPENDATVFYYTISGGRIIGKGANVSWDLSGVRAGTYTITVGIGEDSEVYEGIQTKTITVKECDCPFVDACPTISVSTPTESVKVGETIMFTASVSGISNSNITYNWTVSAGEIVEGQGTPKIKVKTTREMADTAVTASVEINNDRAAFCEMTASKVVSITK